MSSSSALREAVREGKSSSSSPSKPEPNPWNASSLRSEEEEELGVATAEGRNLSEELKLARRLCLRRRLLPTWREFLASKEWSLTVEEEVEMEVNLCFL